MKRTAFVLVILVVLSTITVAQKGGKAAPPPVTPPDFGRLADPSKQNNISFQHYDKTPLKFSSSTTSILVPAVVTDKDGNPVHGLGKDSFKLQENGKDVAIASIEEFNPTTAPIARVAVTPTGKANETTNQVAGDATPRRIVMIVFDMLNTPITDQTRARRALLNYVTDNADPSAVILLASLDSKGLHVLHDFTRDTASLLATLGKVKGSYSAKNLVDSGDVEAMRQVSTDLGAKTIPPAGLIPSGPDGSQGKPDPELAAMLSWANAVQPYYEMLNEQAASSTLSAFLQLGARVSGIPGRKSLVWITGGFPFSLDPGSGAIADGYSFDAYQHVMQKLSDQMISLYPVDARGLLTIGPDASVHLPRREDTRAAANAQAESDRQRDILDTMRAFADMTGGRAYVNTNDTKGAIKEASRDGSSYYMLSYVMDKSDKKPGFRKITVKAGDYKVRARKGYFATQVAIDQQLSAKNDIDAALMSPFDFTGIPMRLVVDQSVASGAKRKVTFMAYLPPKAATIDTADSNHLNVEFAYSVLSINGTDAGHKGVTYNLNLQPQQVDALTTQGLSYGDAVDLPPGRYTVRVVARDNFNGRIGSVLGTVEVK